MNGKTWRISIYVAMLENGETETTGRQVAEIANEMFTESPFSAYELEADWELLQFRKHLAFMRAGAGPTPTLIQLLKWSLTGSGLKPGHPIIRQFQTFLNTHTIASQQLRGMRNERKPPVAESGPAFSTKWRIHPKRGRSADTVAARRDRSGEGDAGVFERRVYRADQQRSDG